MKAGESLGLVHTGTLTYPAGVPGSGWAPCPTPAIYPAPEPADYRRHLPLQSYEGQNPLRGGCFSPDIKDCYVSP
jgi:vanillate/3-O-methylgallate O-demethylase